MKKKVSRGLRNNNPGNIRINSDFFQGEIVPSMDRSFKQFQSMPYGYRAVFRILRNYDKKYALRTIEEMISRWAPSNENDTQAYIAAVSDSAGIPTKDPIDSDNREIMIRIVAGMSKVENGVEPVMADIISGWNLL